MTVDRAGDLRPRLDRFVEADRHDFERALGEIESGRKRSHWMWYVFPQVRGLGLSEMSERYAIGSVAEARAYLEHPVLGHHYRQIVDAVRRQVVGSGVPIRTLFGAPDDQKLVSSLTLFAAVASGMAAPDPDVIALIGDANAILEVARTQGLLRCATTERFLGGS